MLIVCSYCGHENNAETPAERKTCRACGKELGIPKAQAVRIIMALVLVAAAFGIGWLGFANKIRWLQVAAIVVAFVAVFLMPMGPQKKDK